VSREWVQLHKEQLQPYKKYLEAKLQGVAYTNIDQPDGISSMLEKGKGQLLKELIQELEIRKGA